MNLCQYRNMLGRPGEGIHSYRIFNVPVVDAGLTALLAFAIQRRYPKYSYGDVLLYCLLASVVMHRILCEDPRGQIPLAQ